MYIVQLRCFPHGNGQWHTQINSFSVAPTFVGIAIDTHVWRSTVVQSHCRPCTCSTYLLPDYLQKTHIQQQERGNSPTTHINISHVSARTVALIPHPHYIKKIANRNNDNLSTKLNGSIQKRIFGFSLKGLHRFSIFLLFRITKCGGGED